ncbi:hypothetical protein E6C27_scaffold335G00040 [Cucumis melo var. makuwa]|uniref:Uncharacterized protein n=1 Tax=Cucumis melo var. makuwa TaxID=1194695 RepID=A0A5A7TJR0_CUCMM|nr:hypothetical protein E6C27_scaffold335G00040 [Cucumis melo var. makuwa]
MEGCRWLKKLHVHDKRVPERILQLLARYEETLKISNPGTQYNLDTKSDGHFKYVYMAMAFCPSSQLGNTKISLEISLLPLSRLGSIEISPEISLIPSSRPENIDIIFEISLLLSSRLGNTESSLEISLLSSS